MKSEKSTTAPQEWKKRSAERQTEINAFMDEMRVEIQAMNLIIADMYENDSEELDESIENMLAYLEDRWNYHGDVFLVTGQWHEPSSISLSENGIDVQHTKQDAWKVCFSSGFRRKQPDADNPPNIGMSFEVGREFLDTASVSGPFNLLAHASPQEISLQYLRPGSNEIVSADIGEITEAIDKADAVLNLYLSHEESEFYRVSAKKQFEMFTSIKDSVEEVLPPPDTYENLLVEGAKTSTFFIKNFRGFDFCHFKSNSSSDSFEINGRVVGVTILDAVMEGQTNALKSPEDLKVYGGCLCLIIEPDEVNSEIEDYEGNSFIVPVRSLDAYSMSLY